MLVQTDQNSVIGGYCPDQWEDTTGMKCSKGWTDHKDIVSGKPFLFYFLDDQIQFIKHRNDKIPYMRSGKDMRSGKNWLMFFGCGLLINADQNEESEALAWTDYFVHP